MLCPACRQTISPKSRFCMHCGRAVAGEDPAPALPTRIGPLEADRSAFIMARSAETAQDGWNACVIRRDNDAGNSRPAACPEWAERKEWHRWEQRGLAVWVNGTRQCGWLSAEQAVAWIDQLQAHERWQAEGAALVERVTVCRRDEPPAAPRRRSHKKGVLPGPEPAPEAELPRMRETVEETERLRLRGGEAQALVTFLRGQAPVLRELAAMDAERRQQVLTEVYSRLFRRVRETELQKLDLDQAGTRLPWARGPGSNRLICDAAPDRITLDLDPDGIRWRVTIEQPGQFKYDSSRLWRLPEAIEWAETTLLKRRADDQAAAQARELKRADEAARLAALPVMDLTPYRIEPAALEPERAAYRVYLEVYCTPIRCQTLEMSFGGVMEVAREYDSPGRVALELKLDANQLEIEHLAGCTGIYVIRSVVRYYDETLARSQAQALWDQSRLFEQLRARKVICACYGIEEVETEYMRWLGACGEPASTWEAGATRADYMEDRARHATILYALDVNGFRRLTGFSFEAAPDDRLLETMHHRRAAMFGLPADTRADSRRWLGIHNPQPHRSTPGL